MKTKQPIHKTLRLSHPIFPNDVFGRTILILGIIIISASLSVAVTYTLVINSWKSSMDNTPTTTTITIKTKGSNYR